MRHRIIYVYILASMRNGTLYIGMTNNLSARIFCHRNELNEGFTKRYHVHTLVYYEEHDGPLDAIHREKQLKEWRRAWKIALIEKHNPRWLDLCTPEGDILPLPIP